MEKLTVKQFKTWLIANDHTQASLSKVLKITPQTITGYVKNERFPVVFVLALNSISRDRLINSFDDLQLFKVYKMVVTQLGYDHEEAIRYRLELSGRGLDERGLEIPTNKGVNRL